MAHESSFTAGFLDSQKPLTIRQPRATFPHSPTCIPSLLVILLHPSVAVTMRLAHLLISTESPLRAVGACVICAPTVAIQASKAQPQRMHGDVFPQRYIREPQIRLRSAAGILGEMSAYRRLPKSKCLRRDFFF